MGVNTSITLPAQVQLRDVALVLAALDGVPMVRHHFTFGNGGWGADLEGGIGKHIIYSTNDHLPECVGIRWISAEGKARYVLYHFEFGRAGHHGLLPGATPWWIVAGKRLVDVFGGIVDFDDCDNKDQDYVQPIADDISASNGEAWYRWQERLLAVKPITQEELDEARQYAAYKD